LKAFAVWVLVKRGLSLAIVFFPVGRSVEFAYPMDMSARLVVGVILALSLFYLAFAS